MERTNIWIPRGKGGDEMIGTDIYTLLIPCIN